jgi:voltage-gated potassium channel
VSVPIFSRLAALLRTMLEPGPFPTRIAVIYRNVIVLAAVLGTGLRAAATMDDGGLAGDGFGPLLEAAVVTLLAADLGLQAVAAVEFRPAEMSVRSALRRYLVSSYGLIDQLASLPFLVTLVWPLPADGLAVLGVARFLKLARYAPALETLGAVIRREARPLQSASFIVALLMVAASTAQYLAERRVNPEAFGSIPQAMWWGVVTLTTLGYGDAVPVTPLGKVLGGLTALFGIGMFALPASILATGFGEEIRRRDFLAGLNAEQIADITNLLKFFTADLGDVLMCRGELGDRMFFIVSGCVEVDFGGDQPALLNDGDFFGEIALLHNSPRTATVRSRCRCQLLMLDVKDFHRFLVATPTVAELMAETAQRRLSEQLDLADPMV